MLKKELIQFVCSNLPKAVLLEAETRITQAFATSDEAARQRYKHVPLIGPRTQLRHFDVQEAILAMQEVEGATVANMPTKPKGGFYALIRAGHLCLTVTVCASDKTVRESIFRQHLQSFNKRLDHHIGDLFYEVPPHLGPTEHTLHALIIPVANKKLTGDHTTPLSIVIAIPYSNGKGFHLVASLPEIYASYSEEDTTIQDTAYPKLRESMRRSEEDGVVDLPEQDE
ncbi:hypothetical protein GCM10027040_31690 [Halomonas shantousis]